MASTYQRTEDQRWRVAWREGGRRYSRTFHAEADARAFAETFPPNKWRQTGTAPLSVRLERRRRITESGCWEWTGRLSDKGYGQISIYEGGRSVTRSTHRVAYIHYVGEIPEGLELDHLCSNPKCHRPDHLEPVTHAENMRRMGVRKAEQVSA